MASLLPLCRPPSFIGRGRIAARGIKRHVGAVRNPIQNPVAHHANPNGHGASAIVSDQVVDQGKRRDPNKHISKLCGQGKYSRSKGTKRLLPGSTRTRSQQEPGPQQVGAQRRSKQQRQRRVWRAFLGCESYREVSDEHES